MEGGGRRWKTMEGDGSFSYLAGGLRPGALGQAHADASEGGRGHASVVDERHLGREAELAVLEQAIHVGALPHEGSKVGLVRAEGRGKQGAATAGRSKEQHVLLWADNKCC